MTDTASALAQRLRSGGDVTTGDVLAGMPVRMSARDMQRIVNKMRGGEELSPAEQQALSQAQAFKTETSDTMANAGMSLLSEATGVPSIMRGAENIGQAWSEGDAWKGVGGAAQIGLGMIPGAAMTRTAAPMLSGGKGVATAVGLGGATLPMAAQEAGAQARQETVKAIDGDPIVKRLRNELREAETGYTAANNPRINYPSTRARELAVDQFKTKIAELAEQIKIAEDAAIKSFTESAPFRIRHPGAAETLMAGGAAIAGGVPLIKGLADRLRSGKDAIATNWLAGSVRKAMANKDVPAQQLAIRMDELSQRGAAGGFGAAASGAAGHVGGAAKSAGIMAEASSLPEQIDYVSFSPGDPAREAAAKAFRSGDYYTERIAPAVLGAGLYATGASAPQLLPVPKVNKAKVQATLNAGTEAHQPYLTQIERYRGGAGSTRDGSGGQLPHPQDRGTTPHLEAPAPPTPAQRPRTYADAPDGMKDRMRDTYLASASGDSMNRAPSGVARIFDDAYNIPVSGARIKATDDVVESFRQATGRMPTRAEFRALLNKSTLSTLPIAAGGALLGGETPNE